MRLLSFRVGTPSKGRIFLEGDFGIPLEPLESSSEKFETRDWRPGMPPPEKVILIQPFFLTQRS